MRSSPEKVESTIKSLVNRFTTGLKSVCDPPLSIPGVDPQEEDAQSLVDLFLRLTQAFPGDVGCLSVFFLNYVRLKSGEAIFLKVGIVIHFIHDYRNVNTSLFMNTNVNSR
ncbi:unnamed protein product [Hydatigera taeniaeformis]|uniref:PMI_typeI_hel domain-containing protein n=1 Tax=Hydatigena taeniaeformis TaxID=6205 RepID=A0A0R3WY59_HYDTA|nr:unnamed protein product [Hydatigera taeniaeformis]